jgi:hypothetical protein
METARVESGRLTLERIIGFPTVNYSDLHAPIAIASPSAFRRVDRPGRFVVKSNGALIVGVTSEGVSIRDAAISCSRFSPLLAP